MIERTAYLQKLIGFKDKDVIKVVTGVRRCGKSTLFKQFMEHLKSTGVAENQIIFINLEDLAHEDLLDYKKLYAYINERLLPDTPCYVFVDEVQQCPQFEKVIDSLFIKPHVDVYITGSNAYMLSGELATLLSGRYVSIDMLPLSFKEYYSGSSYNNVTAVEDILNESNMLKPNREEAFNSYIKHGSFPYLLQITNNPELINDYLEGIYNTILVKDVAVREGIGDVSLLESIVRVLVSSVGSPVSGNKISNTIQSAGRKISVNTVDTYLRALNNSFIFYKVDRFDVKGRQYLKTLGKYYLVDSGLRNLLLSSQSQDLGHVIENIVYLELLRRDYQVYIGKVGEKEVDFVAKKADGFVYYQVAASVLDPSTLERELAPLNAIKDHFPKVLLTLDAIGSGTTHNGIKQVHLIDWLLGDE